MIRDFAPLLAAVQRNCHIADARYARELTLCTYLLEMREFFRWEQDLPLGAPPPREDVSRWISEREALWEGLVEEEFSLLPLGGQQHDPFDVDAVNAALLPAGLVYGAGIGRFHKPHFFLARLDRAENGDGLAVLVCGCEYARDLTAIPAALQRGTVIVRREALGQWIWEKAEAWGMKRKPGAMARALEAYGYGSDGLAALQRMTEGETEAVILHERGEHAAGKALGADWEAMMAGFGQRRPELLARAVRDHLADCLSTLPTLIGSGNAASLHFWFANFDGLRRDLFPGLVAAYEAWVESGEPAPLRGAVEAGRDHWRQVAERLLDLHRQRGGDAEASITALSANPAALAL